MLTLNISAKSRGERCLRDAGGEADIMRGEGQTIWVRMMIMMMIIIIMMIMMIMMMSMIMMITIIMMNTMMISEVQKLAILSLFTLVKK